MDKEKYIPILYALFELLQFIALGSILISNSLIVSLILLIICVGSEIMQIYISNIAKNLKIDISNYSIKRSFWQNECNNSLSY